MTKGKERYECVSRNGVKYEFYDLESYQKFIKQNTHLFVELPELPIIKGVGKDAPTVTNAKGGSQSEVLYRLDLVDPKVILEVARVLKEGADKYGEENWRLIDTKDHLNHLLIHTYAYLAGDKSDKHLSHIICRAIFALGVELEKPTQNTKEEN